MNALIGYTGFVGQNLVGNNESELFNSKNILDIKGREYNRVVCAGIRAEKYLANLYPEQDLGSIKELISVLEQVKCKQFILISTIDVYKNPIDVNEKSKIEIEGLHAYGLNRYFMEEYVRSNYDEYLIVRLPALFGKGLKKNFIFDMLTLIPSMIMSEKYNQILKSASTQQAQRIRNGYIKNDKGNWIVKETLSKEEEEKLKITFEEIGFTSLVFTDHRSKFPFYDLSNLSSDIKIAIDHNIKELNISVEPISAAEIAEECFGMIFKNEIHDKEPVYYNIKSIYADIWNGKNGYMYSKNQTLSAIKKFVEQY